MDAQVEAREQQANDDATDEERVQLEVLQQPTFLPKEPDLLDNDDKQDNDDDGERGLGARLLLQVMTRQS
ncbi:hypothetical protein HYQ46_009027 [Verticillium longisporum]|nr:hypothetical protein HYQ46_009027 [Verticillium longisporum]